MFSFEKRRLQGKQQLFFGAVFRHSKDKIRGNQHGFTKGKSYLTNPVAFYEDKMNR